MLRERDTFPFGEGWLEIWQLQGCWPVCLVRGSLYLEYFENLVNFWVSSEKCFSLSHLCKNAADRPNINWSWVLFLT
jgi:hypothetical protein